MCTGGRDRRSIFLQKVLPASASPPLSNSVCRDEYAAYWTLSSAAWSSRFDEDRSTTWRASVLRLNVSVQRADRLASRICFSADSLTIEKRDKGPRSWSKDACRSDRRSSSM